MSQLIGETDRQTDTQTESLLNAKFFSCSAVWRNFPPYHRFKHTTIAEIHCFAAAADTSKENPAQRRTSKGRSVTSQRVVCAVLESLFRSVACILPNFNLFSASHAKSGGDFLRAHKAPSQIWKFWSTGAVRPPPIFKQIFFSQTWDLLGRTQASLLDTLGETSRLNNLEKVWCRLRTCLLIVRPLSLAFG